MIIDLASDDTNALELSDQGAVATLEGGENAYNESVQNANESFNGSEHINGSPADFGLDFSLESIDINPFGDVNYFVLLVSVIVILFYLIGQLFEKGIINRKKHYKIWNWFLILTLLGSGITGIILVIKINFAIKILSALILFAHVEISVIIVLLTLVHFHLYRKPIKVMLKMKWAKINRK